MRETTTFVTHKILLQLVVALACLIPLSAGLVGALGDAQYLGISDINRDSHVRYLSGLLLGIGIGFASTIRRIEHHTARFRLLTGIVMVGGVCRLAGFFLTGMPGVVMLAALAMELVVTPALCFWQARIVKLSA